MCLYLYLYLSVCVCVCVCVCLQYFYSIKDISVGGQCICYGHARYCPVDPVTRVSHRPHTASERATAAFEHVV